jgi:perosamine synthetase
MMRFRKNQRFIPVAKPILGRREKSAVNHVLRSGMLSQGPEVERFENDFAKHVLNQHCIAVNSGTSGLVIALLAAGISKGDEVIVPSFTFAATANSVVLAGGVPVFVDIDPLTFNLDPSAVEASITHRTKAIQVVHLYGQPADMKAIMKIAQKYNLIVLEDAAQAHLAELDGKPVGTFGQSGVFSFYPTKNMTAGEGGLITTRSDELARLCRLLRNQGMQEKYQNEIIGFNNRMTDIHASIARVQLTKLREWTEKRRKNAEFFDKNLIGVVTPFVSKGSFHVYHQYTIRIIDSNRDKFMKEMARLGIGSGVYYPTPVHKLKSFKVHSDLAETERACREVLSIPVHPSLSQRDLDRIVTVINTIAAAGT